MRKGRKGWHRKPTMSLQLFQTSIVSRFSSLDTNGDGLISFAEMAKELMSLSMLPSSSFGANTDQAGLTHSERVELHRDIFSRFDSDGAHVVNFEEFQEEMKEMLSAVADRIDANKFHHWIFYARL